MVWFSFIKANRRVTCYYFYLWDVDFGPAFVKMCAYFPYPIKMWLNGHEWAKRQAAGAGIGFTELSNGFGTCPSPTTEKEASHTSFTGFDGRFSTVLDNAVPFAAGRGSRRLSALGAPGGGARRHLLRAGVRQELDTKPNEVDEDELRTAVSTLREIDETRSAFNHAKMLGAVPDAPFPMPNHTEEKGRMKMPAFSPRTRRTGFAYTWAGGR